ncbi:hypothetical protein HYPSUDRAFT_206012 [Hypholoma sublateritium FD-334 SS-4]|uniref:C2H2-type domain-containing protein n=1 Tax=Hypholoma sublateritium (strain FD-334 SS-4) TaxID=945553 RepID=A0A0D2NLW5_HYPSF|nr:hypothetical protein HYPSUDRAFT_206012 [Hypholoma sublateritium FD-334 SS-4]
MSSPVFTPEYLDSTSANYRESAYIEPELLDYVHKHPDEINRNKFINTASEFSLQPSTSIVRQWTTGTATPEFPNMMGNVRPELSYSGNNRLSTHAFQVPQPFLRPFTGFTGGTAPIGTPIFFRSSLNFPQQSTGIGAQANTNSMRSSFGQRQQVEYETSYLSPGQTHSPPAGSAPQPSVRFTQWNSVHAEPQVVNSPSLEQTHYLQDHFYPIPTSNLPVLQTLDSVTPLTTGAEEPTYLPTEGSGFDQASYAPPSSFSMTSDSPPFTPAPFTLKFVNYVPSAAASICASAKAKPRTRKPTATPKRKSKAKGKAAILGTLENKRRRSYVCNKCRRSCGCKNDLKRHHLTHLTAEQKGFVCTVVNGVTRSTTNCALPSDSSSDEHSLEPGATRMPETATHLSHLSATVATPLADPHHTRALSADELVSPTTLALPVFFSMNVPFRQHFER